MEQGGADGSASRSTRTYSLQKEIVQLGQSTLLCKIKLEERLFHAIFTHMGKGAKRDAEKGVGVGVGAAAASPSCFILRDPLKGSSCRFVDFCMSLSTPERLFCAPFWLLSFS